MTEQQAPRHRMRSGARSSAPAASWATPSTRCRRRRTQGAGTPEEGRGPGEGRLEPDADCRGDRRPGRAGRAGPPDQEAMTMAETRAATAPDAPTDLGGRGWWAALKRTVREFRDDNLTDWAAALTYYSVLAIFPALIVLVSILGLVGRVGDAAADRQPRHGRARPGQGDRHERDQEPPGRPGRRRGPVHRRPGRRAVVGVGLRRRLHARVQLDLRHRRGPAGLEDAARRESALTLVLLVLLAVTRSPSCSPGRCRSRSATCSASATRPCTVWDIAKWPVLLIVVSFMFALLYWAAPNVKQPGFRWVTPGGILAVVDAGSSPRPRSRSTSPTSAPTTRPTERSAA